MQKQRKFGGNGNSTQTLMNPLCVRINSVNVERRLDTSDGVIDFSGPIDSTGNLPFLETLLRHLTLKMQQNRNTDCSVLMNCLSASDSLTSSQAESLSDSSLISRRIVSGRVVSADGHGTKSQVTNNQVQRKTEWAQSSHSGRSIAAQLLADINIIFRTKNVSKLRTTSLLSALCADADKPWATFCNGRSISARRLSSILSEFRTGIHSKDIRFKAGVFKGYYRKTIAEACRRFNVA